MARRLIEADLQAQKQMEKGESWAKTFSKVKVIKEIPCPKERQGVFCLQFSFDGEQLAVGYANGAVDLLNAKTGALIHELRRSRYGGFQCMCLRFNPKDHNVLFATTSEGHVYSCDTQIGTSVEMIVEKGNEINCLDFCADGFYFATAGKDLAVRIYDTKTQQLVTKYEGYSPETPSHDVSEIGANAMRVFALKYHPLNDDVFVTGGWENHLKVWDSRSRDGVKRTIRGPHLCGDSLDLKDYKILTGSWVGIHSLQTWNYSEGNLEQTLPFPESEHGEFLYSAQFCDNDVVLAGGSGTNSAAAINSQTREILGEVKMTRPVQAVDSTHGGRLFAVAGADDYIKLAAIC